MVVRRVKTVHMIAQREKVKSKMISTTKCGIVSADVEWASWHDRVTCFECILGPVL